MAGQTVEASITPRQLPVVRKLVSRLTVIRTTETGQVNVRLTLLSGTKLDQVLNGIQPPILPPLWLGVAAMDVLPGRDIYLLYINPSYLREANVSFTQFTANLELLGQGYWNKLATNQDELTLQLQVVAQLAGSSLVDLVLQARDAQRPRELTAAELDEVLAQIPPLPSLDTVASAVQHREILKHVRTQLIGTKLSPMQLPRFKQVVRDYYLRALIQPYEKVGVTAAESITAPVMQNTLNSRHKFGTSTGMSATIDLFEQVLLSQYIKEPEMTIFFEDRGITENEIIDSKVLFEQVTFENLIANTRVLALPAPLPPEWRFYARLKGIAIPAAEIMLEMEIDAQIMFDHQLSVERLIQVIEGYTKAIVTIPSALTLDAAGIPRLFLYLIPIKDQTRDAIKDKKLTVSDQMLEKAFLTVVTLPDLKPLLISGITGIRSIEPRRAEIMTEKGGGFILSAEIVSAGEQTVQWELRLDKYLMRRNLIIVNDIVRFLRRPEFGLTDVQVVTPVAQHLEEVGDAPDRILVRSKPIAVNLLNHMTKIIGQESNDWKKQQEATRKATKNPYHVQPLTPLLQANRVYFAQAAGSNLRQVCLLDAVDPYHTYCNDPAEMSSVFGVEVAMVLIIKILLDVLEATRVYIDLAHVKLAAELKCNQGIILGLNYYGGDRQGSETLAQATSRKAVSVIVKAASTGRLEPNSSASTAVLTGSLGQFGSAMVKVIPTAPAIGSIPRELGVPTARRTTAAANQDDEADLVNAALAITATSEPVASAPTGNPAGHVIGPTTVLATPMPVPTVEVTTPVLVPPVSKQEEDFQATSQYTRRAANNIKIPVAPIALPAFVTTNVTHKQLPEFEFLDLALPAVLAQLLGPEPAPVLTPAPVKPTAKLASLAGLLRRAK